MGGLMSLWAHLQGGFHNQLIVEITAPKDDISSTGEFVVGVDRMAELYAVSSFSPKDKKRLEFVDADTNKRRTVRALPARFLRKLT